MILAEITAAIDEVGTLQTFYFGSEAYQTRPTDYPANINFEDRMRDPGSLSVNVYGNGRTGGYGALSVGQMKLANADYRLDIMRTYGTDGRTVVLRLYKAGVPYASMPILFTGTVDGPPTADGNELIIRLKDKRQILEVTLACPNTYPGDNVLPNGINGGPELKGKRIARVYGIVLNISPDCVNTDLQIFRVNDGPVQAISAVYDKGDPYPFDGDYATNALLQAASITAGRYATCLAEGLFRINSAIAGQITADVTQGATAANRTAAQINSAIAILAGVPPSEISSADVAALDVLQPAEVGIYITDETKAREAINSVAESIGAFAVFDALGILRMGRLSEPEGTPVLTLTNSQALSLKLLSQLDGDIPISSMKLNHTKNWTPQDPGSLAGLVASDLARVEFLKNEWRSAFDEAPAVKIQYLLAPPFEANSLIHDPTNLDTGPAKAEATRLLLLYKQRRDLFQVTVHLNALLTAGVPSLMSLVQLQTPRYGLAAGRLFWVLGVALELRQSQVVLTLWG